MPTPLVTLTTDFGTSDGYVGAMKGVIARLAPEATVVDVAHDIPRHDIAHGAWVLAGSAFEFPVGTIHVAVVDPGVGGARAAVIVATRGHLFVGPDNGLFAYVAEGADAVHAITETSFRFPEASPTFHGRDVFAPAAAALARGLPPSAAGPTTCLAGTLPWRTATAPDATAGVIVHVDSYGNLVSNLRAAASRVALGPDGEHEISVRRTYEDVADGALVAYLGSAGTLEVAMRGGSAADALHLGRGARIRVR
jgi:S-adenosylmethionine hydrolase